MSKYIDAEKLIKFKEMLADIIASSQGICTYQACKDMAEEEALLLIATLQQEQPEDSKGKFVFPKFLYARTLDNKTIDVSYVPQSMEAIEYVRNDIQEQPEDIVIIAKTFLDALSKTPYNNMPITDAQIIVKQLLLFFENPKEYNPDAILEQPDVDLEKKVEEYFQGYWPGMETPEQCNTDMHFTPPAIMRLVKYAYELGLKARKEESK